MSDETKVEEPDSTGKGEHAEPQEGQVGVEEAEPQEGQPGVDDDDAMTHAADEATDVWDEDSLRAAGLGDLLDQEAKAEAKAKDAQKMAAPKVSTDAAADNPSEGKTGPDTLPPPPSQGGLSWTATVALAVVLGVAVFFLVKLFR